MSLVEHPAKEDSLRLSDGTTEQIEVLLQERRKENEMEASSELVVSFRFCIDRFSGVAGDFAIAFSS